MAKLIVVEDDGALLRLVSDFLGRAGHDVTACARADDALEKLEGQRFDMLLSDIMMPGMDGFELAERVRAFDKETPILFLTARDDKVSKQRGYALGIDDYVVKPFDPDILVLRVEAVLRRAGIGKTGILTAGNFTMDSEARTATVDGEEISLTVREFDILYRLLSFPKKTFTRSRLMQDFWDFDTSASSRTVDVYMAKIREKTERCDGFEIVTVHGLGYKAVLK